MVIPNDENTELSHDNTVYIYTPLLDDSCSDTVTSIRFCYEYNTSGIGADNKQLAFDWTVLTFTVENNDFKVARTYRIVSSPQSLACTGSDGKQICCDETTVDEFDIPKTDFIFGITKSDTNVSNTAATLLMFQSSLGEYRVDTRLVARDGRSLTQGSSIPMREVPSPVPRGLHCLWFITGKGSIHLNGLLKNMQKEVYSYRYFYVIIRLNYYTVDREIFAVKNFSSTTITDEN